MKKITILLLFCFVSLCVFSQSNYSIAGKVIDATTKLPLLGASVFAENTTLGTATNADGNFHLTLPGGGYSIVVTFTGYQPESRRVTAGEAGNSEMVIEIKQKEKSLEEFVIKSTNEVADGLAKYGDFFLENFIGKTANSKQCYIRNKEVLKFFYYRRAKRLKIVATAPLEIVNDALGYTIKYELDSFVHEYNTQVSIYTGYPLFQEMQSSDITQLEKWNAARKTAYNGSILHFMRSMYQKKLAEQGFEIQFIVKNNDKEQSIRVKDFYGGMNYTKDESSGIVEIMPNQKEVAILYKNEPADQLYVDANPEASTKFQLSLVLFQPNESLGIEQNGFYFEQNDITINGYWAWEKVGDMVPYDYNFTPQNPPAVTAQSSTSTTEPVKPVGIEVKSITEQPKLSGLALTDVTWKMEESKGIDGVNKTYYVRGGPGNTIDYDNDFYKFNTDNTGTYSSNGQEHKFNWQYLNPERNKIEMIILDPKPLVVTLDNIILTNTSFKYTRSQTVNGAYLIAIESRTIK